MRSMAEDAGPRSNGSAGCFPDYNSSPSPDTVMDNNDFTLDFSDDDFFDWKSWDENNMYPEVPSPQGDLPLSVPTLTYSDSPTLYDPEDDVLMSEPPAKSDFYNDPIPTHFWPRIEGDPVSEYPGDIDAHTISETPATPDLTCSSAEHSKASSEGHTPASSISSPPSSSSGEAARTRILKSPEDTNQVRKIGACLRCKVMRVKV